MLELFPGYAKLVRIPWRRDSLVNNKISVDRAIVDLEPILSRFQLLT